MFIFQRRLMQAMLHELAFLTPQERQKLADRLNRPGSDRMAAMWKLVFLWGLSRIGHVDHEILLDNGRRPDIRFESTGPAFIADVTALSDSGIEGAAGVQALWDDIQRVGRKYGLSGNGLSLDVKSAHVGSYGDTVVEVHLPEPKDRARVVKVHVEPFLKAQRQAKEAVSLVVDEPGVGFTLSYNPGQMYATRSHVAYTAPGSLKDNPLARRVKEKTGQLRGAPADLPRGLIVCDAGSDLMRRSDAINGRGYSRRGIALAALEATTAIDFMVMASVVAAPRRPGARTTYGWHIDVVASKRAVTEGRLASGVAEQIEGVFQNMFSLLPPLVNDAMNVAYRVLEAEAPDMIGGYHWDGDMFRISSRAVTDLLAGTISQDDFHEAYGWRPGQKGGIGNPFAAARARGQLIQSVSVEPSEDTDDDWLVVRFGRPDPAVAPFTGDRIETSPEPASDPTRT